MSQSSSLTLVRQLFEPDANWKQIGLDLGTLPPDEPAALRVIQGFRQRQLPAWLTAFLLGQIRHSAGYDVTRQILLGKHELSYESYAAVALAQIDRHRAYDDLWEIFRSHNSKRSRRHIVYGLLATGSPRLWDDLCQATMQQLLVPASRAASVLADCSPTVDQLLKLLRSGDPRQQELGLMVLDNLRPKTHFELGPSVVASANQLLGDPSVAVNSARRQRLSSWLLR